jgi:hypothetical protein
MWVSRQVCETFNQRYVQKSAALRIFGQPDDEDMRWWVSVIRYVIPVFLNQFIKLV